MNKIEIIKEILHYAKTVQPIKYLIKAEEQLGHEDLSLLIAEILHWQKDVKNPDKAWPIPGRHKDHANIIHEIEQKKFQTLFNTCPKLSDVFIYKNNTIYYAPNLLEEEKNEILDHINENHFIRTKKIPKRPKRFDVSRFLE